MQKSAQHIFTLGKAAFKNAMAMLTDFQTFTSPKREIFVNDNFYYLFYKNRKSKPKSQFRTGKHHLLPFIL